LREEGGSSIKSKRCNKNKQWKLERRKQKQCKTNIGLSQKA
jgi:hypothetical protein